jgi:hypothetical protein
LGYAPHLPRADGATGSQDPDDPNPEGRMPQSNVEKTRRTAMSHPLKSVHFY